MQPRLYIPRPFLAVRSFGTVVRISAHDDRRLRGKGQPLEGDFEQTNLSTKSRLGLRVLAGVPARHYSIRWLACRSNEGGIVRPRDFALVAQPNVTEVHLWGAHERVAVKRTGGAA